MDEISSEYMATLVGKRIKLEVSGSSITGIVLSVQGGQVMIKVLSKKRQSREVVVSVDEIDALIIYSKSKKVGY
ncbi:hypothetical protein [Ammoniphilus sp. CFH 90114]|uniref:hypothetical protein n=1 Tax=Ammoniphilus sp. CFH 90114 TaxID=2493665 RepID=UPI00100E8399|nr:hypothetical protein [Ammoniphilus sp. CFH 90114]RXT15291.1 hypothetical protein EIZ39_03530 [Ammoniphilus sp. CFH 90114]